jgi:hypothetical protein
MVHGSARGSGGSLSAGRLQVDPKLGEQLRIIRLQPPAQYESVQKIMYENAEQAGGSMRASRREAGTLSRPHLRAVSVAAARSEHRRAEPDVVVAAEQPEPSHAAQTHTSFSPDMPSGYGTPRAAWLTIPGRLQRLPVGSRLHGAHRAQRPSPTSCSAAAVRVPRARASGEGGEGTCHADPWRSRPRPSP